jgi:hypothetical protein
MSVLMHLSHVSGTEYELVLFVQSEGILGNTGCIASVPHVH